MGNAQATLNQVEATNQGVAGIKNVPCNSAYFSEPAPRSRFFRRYADDRLGLSHPDVKNPFAELQAFAAHFNFTIIDQLWSYDRQTSRHIPTIEISLL